MIRVARGRNISKADCKRMDDLAWELGARLLTIATPEQRERRQAVCKLILRLEIELGNCAPVM